MLCPSFYLKPARTEDLAQHLAADILLTSLMVSHHALGSRQDRDAEAVSHGRDRLDRNVNATAWLRNAGDLTDHRLTFVVLEFDLKLSLAIVVFDLGVVADVAFSLQNV